MEFSEASKKITRKIRVGVLYGGRSGEHEVSLLSAASVIRNLDQERFEIIPIGIDKDGRWKLGNQPVLSQKSGVLTIPDGGNGAVLLPKLGLAGFEGAPLDVVFPAVHGTFCEDGSLQGLLETADIAYVGSGVLASAVGMDKDVAKRLAKEAGIAVAPYIVLKRAYFKREPLAIYDRIQGELGFPVFVKPANAGSSVGVHKVKEVSGLETAINDAFRYDTKLLVEKSVRAREIEVAVLESLRPGEAPKVSVVGEIKPTHEFYSYEAKYLDKNGAELIVPALLTPQQMAQAQEMASNAFEALECEGMARVDLFLDQDTGSFYFNELNTLPGFTQISMYPRLWEASGLSYSELLSHLIDLAISRQARKRNLVRDFEGAG